MSPSYNHAAIAVNIGTVVNSSRKFRAFSELTLVIDGADYIPDISVYAWRKIDIGKDFKKMQELPLLVAEILFPSQPTEELTEKAEVYLNAGIRSVWIVQPFAHTVSVLTKEGMQLYHEGVLEDLTGLSVNLASIFDDETEI